MTSAQEARADGWQHTARVNGTTIAVLARDNRELLSELRYLDAENGYLASEVQRLTTENTELRAQLDVARCMQ